MGLIPTLRMLRGDATCPECGAERDRDTRRHPTTLLMCDVWDCPDCGDVEVIDGDAGERGDFTRESEWRELR